MKNNKDIRSWISEILVENERYSKSKGYIGYDPLMNWSLPGYRAYKDKPTIINKVLRRTEQEALKLFPFLLVPYFNLNGIKPELNYYGLSIFIQAYCKMYEYFGDKSYLEEAVNVYDLLHPFLVDLKHGKGVPNPPRNRCEKFFNGLKDDKTAFLVTGSELVFGLIDLYKLTSKREYLELAESITDSFVFDFNTKYYEKRSKIVLDYCSCKDGSHILNANALAAKAMCLVMEEINERKYIKIVEGINKYIAPYLLLEDIPYAGNEDQKINPNYKNCDSYHTGFTIRGLYYSAVFLGDNDVVGFCVSAAKKYFHDFIDDGGIVRLFKGSNVCDIHGVAEFILFFAEFESFLSDQEKENIIKCIVANVDYMYMDGHYYYRRENNKKYPVYFPRWSQAPMMKALSSVLLRGVPK